VQYLHKTRVYFSEMARTSRNM